MFNRVEPHNRVLIHFQLSLLIPVILQVYLQFFKDNIMCMTTEKNRPDVN